LKGRWHLGDLETDGRITLTWALKQEVSVWIEFYWLKIETGRERGGKAGKLIKK
jgi:hypothetical protein